MRPGSAAHEPIKRGKRRIGANARHQPDDDHRRGEGVVPGRRNERFSFLLDKFIEHLHDFTRETNLTQDEWMYVLNFLYDCGKISTPERHEFILLSDVLGWSALVDMINTKGGGTELSNLGPFYLKDAPVMALGPTSPRSAKA